MSAGKTIINLIKFIAAVCIGVAIVYMWTTIRGEEDWMLLAGIGIVSTLVSFTLLYMFGKSGSS